MRKPTTKTARIAVSANYEIDVTPAALRRYPQRIELSSPDYTKRSTEKKIEGRGYTILLEQIADHVPGEQAGEPKVDVMPENPRAYVQGTLYSASDGNYIEIGGDGVVDVRELEDFAHGILNLIENARRRGLFPRRPRSRADARGVELTEKGKAALAGIRKPSEKAG